MIYSVRGLRTLLPPPPIFLLAFGLTVFAVGCNDSAVTEISQDLDKEKMVVDRELVSKIVDSDEFKQYDELAQKSLSTLFDAMDNGVTKESLSKAFKADMGILDGLDGEDEDAVSLSNIFPSDHVILVKETARSLREKFPILSDIQNEPGFSESCEIDEEEIDRFFENLDQFRDLPLPTASLILRNAAKASIDPDDEECPECCKACSAGRSACGDMVRTLACSLLGAPAGWLGWVGGLWICGCTFCPEDLPCWACGTCHEGDQDDDDDDDDPNEDDGGGG